MGEPRTALVTGAAGFIGHALCRRLLDDGFRVVGVDSLSDYYDPALKARRQAMLLQSQGMRMLNQAIETPGLLAGLFAEEAPDIVVHLAAQAGVRYSIDNPRSYLDSNITGTFELLEAARAHPPQHLLLASTSSVYGANSTMPYRETDRADYPMSFYAATKKATEVMAHSYAHLFDLPITMFRFFTVYGPWGRPDMALFKFTRAILSGEPIEVYNHGRMRRDFTYIDDLVEALRRLIDIPPGRNEEGMEVENGDSLSPVAPWRVLNVGNAQPVELETMIAMLETALGKKARRIDLPMQPGDVPATWADTALLKHLTGYVPDTDMSDGIARFAAWYREYYGV